MIKRAPRHCEPILKGRVRSGGFHIRKHTTRRLVRWALAGLMLCLAWPVQAEIRLGVHPFKPASKLFEAFTPLTDYLSEKMGEKVSLQISKDYQIHTDAIGKGDLDIAYLGPASYVSLRDNYGEIPLLARQAINGNPVFRGKIFVRKSSPIQNLSDLKGKKFAFGEPYSTMSHLVPRYTLYQAGISVEQFSSYKFVGDHINVALGVLSGDFDAGATKEDVYYKYETRGVRSIATTPPLSDHLFVARKNLSPAKVTKLREILLNIDKDPKGQNILQSMTTGVTALLPVQDSDYDSLRAVLKIMKEIGVPY